MARAIPAILVLLLLVSCGRIFGQSEGGGGDGPVLFDGVQYDARLSKDEEDERAFVVTVSPAGNLEAAQEAGRYEATKYCLRNFGGSDAAWTVGPDDPIDTLTVTDGTITMAGRCTKR